MSLERQIDVQDLDHLGIIAGIVDDIGIVKIAVHGKYETVEGREGSIVENESGEPLAIAITQGYSRDNRPDLKQCTCPLMTSEEEGIPLYMNVGDGNKIDLSAFPEVIKAFRSEWETGAN